MILALIILSLVSLFVGAINMSVLDILSADGNSRLIFFMGRLPRLLALLVTGCAMSIAGLIMQVLCRNKFISPTTGTTLSSAQLGILIALLFVPSSTLMSRALFSFAFALGGTWVFVFFINRIKFRDTVMVPLVGIMMGNVITGVTSFLAYQTDMTQAISTWQVGHFSLVVRGRYELVYITLPLIILAFIYANHFNIVGMGKNFSKNLGIHYNRMLFLGLTIAAAITASIVVVVGSVSYVGLIIPNLVSMFKGDNLRGTLRDTALAGSLFVLFCDIVARLVIHPYELPIDLIIGIIGSIVFVAMLLWKLKHGDKAIRLNLHKGGPACQ